MVKFLPKLAHLLAPLPDDRAQIAQLLPLVVERQIAFVVRLTRRPRRLLCFGEFISRSISVCFSLLKPRELVDLQADHFGLKALATDSQLVGERRDTVRRMIGESLPRQSRFAFQLLPTAQISLGLSEAVHAGLGQSSAIACFCARALVQQLAAVLNVRMHDDPPALRNDDGDGLDGFRGIRRIGERRAVDLNALGALLRNVEGDPGGGGAKLGIRSVEPSFLAANSLHQIGVDRHGFDLPPRLAQALFRVQGCGVAGFESFELASIADYGEDVAPASNRSLRALLILGRHPSADAQFLQLRQLSAIQLLEFGERFPVARQRRFGVCQTGAERFTLRQRADGPVARAFARFELGAFLADLRLHFNFALQFHTRRRKRFAILFVLRAGLDLLRALLRRLQRLQCVGHLAPLVPQIFKLLRQTVALFDGILVLAARSALRASQPFLDLLLDQLRQFTPAASAQHFADFRLQHAAETRAGGVGDFRRAE